MNREKFFKTIDKALGLVWREKIEWAYALAKQFHCVQKRNDGTRYFEHCRETALLLVKYGPTTPYEIIVALLHDIYEDQFVPRGMIERLFGSEIEEAIKLLSKDKPFYEPHGKVSKNKLSDDDYFKAIIPSSRLVIRVKLADRLHNLMTLKSCPREKIARKVKETREYLLPLAQEVDRKFARAIEMICEQY